MGHFLDFLKREWIIEAIQKINIEGDPKNNEWSEYWIKYKDKLYQFKYLVELASSFSKTPIKTSDFASNDSSRNFITKLGFHIVFKSSKNDRANINYWVGATYYGDKGSQIDIFDEFIKNKYWRTDHDLDGGEGLNIYNQLKKVQVNDRVCLRYFDKKGGKIQIATMGTVEGTSNINNGRLKVNWDYNPPLYTGIKPSGNGAGNWWKTIFQLKRDKDIKLIFSEVPKEKRVARITWNENGWVFPSGVNGKSDYKDSHEKKYGYGHEEWLFDTGKLIDGFHYGFLEPVRKEQNSYKDKIFDVWLYTINGNNKKRYWIGEIHNLSAIGSDEAQKVKNQYEKNGWLKEMIQQLRNVGVHNFSDWSALDLFNVKFKPDDLFVDKTYYKLSSNHPINKLSRYAFTHYRKEYSIQAKNILDKEFKFIPPQNSNKLDVKPKQKTHSRQKKEVEILYLHKAISDSLSQDLEKNYGWKNVRQEHPSGFGANKVDIVVNAPNKIIFYEIKTYNSLITSIREAFGQLMEYSFFPNHQKADELIILTQKSANEYVKAYMSNLRKTFNIPIYYQSYDLPSRTLSKKW